MDPTILNEYKKRRAEGIPASSALYYGKHALKAQQRPRLDVPEPNSKRVEVPLGLKEIQVYAAVEYDEHADYDFDGSWLHRRDNPKIVRGKSWDWSIPSEGRTVRADIIEITEKFYYRSGSRRESFSRVCHKFQPACSYRSHYESLRKSYGKHEADCLARSYVLQTLKRCMDENRAQYVVTVEAYAGDVCVASASVGGVETGDTSSEYDDYITDVIWEQVSEVKHDLKRSLLAKQKALTDALAEIGVALKEVTDGSAA